MPIDRYTRTILTIIAGALVYIGAMLSGPTAAAQGGSAARTWLEPGKAQPVVIVGWGSVGADGQIVLNTVRDRSGATRTDSTLPVALQAGREPLPVVLQGLPRPLPVSLGVTAQEPLPVAVTEIRAGTQWDEVRTKVDQPLTRVPGKP